MKNIIILLFFIFVPLVAKGEDKVPPSTPSVPAPKEEPPQAQAIDFETIFLGIAVKGLEEHFLKIQDIKSHENSKIIYRGHSKEFKDLTERDKQIVMLSLLGKLKESISETSHNVANKNQDLKDRLSKLKSDCIDAEKNKIEEIIKSLKEDDDLLEGLKAYQEQLKGLHTQDI